MSFLHCCIWHNTQDGYSAKSRYYEAVWKESGDGGTAVTNVVSQIRRKIGDKYIRTVIGSGYKFEV